MYKIYIVRNTVNGKIYVGLTRKSIEHRWKWHVYASNHYKKTQIVFLRAIRKYGPEAFTIKEIDSATDKHLAYGLEMAYILLYQATNPELGYNGTFGGDGGQIPTQATRDKIAATRKLRGLTCAWMGSPNEAAVRAKISAGKMGAKNPNFGKPSPFRKEIPFPESADLYANGTNTRQLAKKYNVSQSVVCKRLRDHGVKLRDVSECQSGPLSCRWRPELHV